MKFSINDFFIFCSFFISSFFISLKIYGCLFELYLDCILCFANVSDQFISRPIAEIVKKVSVSGVFLVHIFQCSDWIRRFTEYPIQMQKNVNPKNFKSRHTVRSEVVLVTAADSSHPKKLIVQSKSFFSGQKFQHNKSKLHQSVPLRLFRQAKDNDVQYWSNILAGVFLSATLISVPNGQNQFDWAKFTLVLCLLLFNLKC